MKLKKSCILVVLTLTCVAVLPLQLCGRAILGGVREPPLPYCALDGLKGVNVRVVHEICAFEPDRLPRNPIDVNELCEQAEHLLHATGVQVFEYPLHNPEMAELVITVRTWRTRFAYSYVLQVKTELYQLAEIVRGRKLMIMAPTWPRGARVQEAELTAVVNLHHLRGTIQKEIERQIRIFAKDLVRANHDAMTGTVRYIGLEGGFFGIIGDDGVHYDPHNLPREFAVDGLRVMFHAVEEKHVGCIHMWGRIVRIIWIEKLPSMTSGSS